MSQIYNTRNLNTIATLADNTKVKATQFYNKCIELKAQVLIYEGIRTLEQQKKNVASGASKTLRSYHLVGQAFDFVPIDSKGNAVWSVSAYKKSPYKEAIAYAKSIGLVWGGDWTSLVDCPHFQFEYKGYGTDTFSGKVTPSTPPISRSYLIKGDKGSEVTKLQQDLKTVGYAISVDGIYGDATVKVVTQFQKDNKLSADGVFGVKSKVTLDKLVKDKQEASKPKPTAPPAPSTIKAVGKIKVDKVTNFTYVYSKADDKSAIVQNANKGSTFDISGSVVGWYEVIVNNKRCYIKSKYCTKI